MEQKKFKDMIVGYFQEARELNKLNNEQQIEEFSKNLIKYMDDFDKIILETQIKDLGKLIRSNYTNAKCGIIIGLLIQYEDSIPKITKLLDENKELRERLEKFNTNLDDTFHYIR